jgi:predicted nuclease of predicted toxin-antitoxin system
VSHIPPIRFFIDHCVPESVARALEAADLEVIRLREKTAPDSPDPLVAAVAQANNAVLVTMDGDFKKIAGRNGVGRRRQRFLSLVRFEKVREFNAASRLRCALSLILHEWTISQDKSDRRIFIVIMPEVIRTHR